jgi:hypothetical protein
VASSHFEYVSLRSATLQAFDPLSCGRSVAPPPQGSFGQPISVSGGSLDIEATVWLA